MTPPTAYMLIGPPGAGKSTWCASNLATMNNAMLISSDAVVERAAAENDITYSEAIELLDYDRDIVPLLRDDILAAVKARRDIVFDLTNRNTKERMTFRHLIPIDYVFVAVQFEFDENEIRQRVRERGERTGKIIPDEVLDTQFREYTPPQPFEFGKTIIVPR